MATCPERKDDAGQPAPFPLPGYCEILGFCFLALLAAYFLRVSWRKWPDPIVDAGAQWYGFWRVSQGAMPYHDFIWHYGPLSLVCNGLLFKWFGPGMMVLVTANLVVYAAILSLAYLAFRMAWGWLAAFAASAVFIAVFSFSILNAVGNYNFATPYAEEATHGLLVMLVTVFIAVRWCRAASVPWAFGLGLCGGAAAVLKPEFMLTGGVLGIAALVLRYRQHRPVRVSEYASLVAGVVLPTLTFTVWFARRESWSAALVDSCQAWWPLLFNQANPEMVLSQASFLGLDHPWRNAGLELEATLCALAVIAAIWAFGRFINRPRPLHFLTALAAIALACLIPMDKGWFEVGRCLPGLMICAILMVGARLRNRLRSGAQLEERDFMALALVLLAGTMLFRMALRARVYHFGFYQAAIAGMVTAAFIVAEVPRWAGVGKWGRLWATVAGVALLAIGCASIARQSARIRNDQTQVVGSGSDRFYAFDPEVDETGSLVNWLVERLRSVADDATLLVMPVGVMINYLSRHPIPLPEMENDEEGYLKLLNQSPPDYVIIIKGNLRTAGVGGFGDPGQRGEKITQWLRENYVVADSHPGRAAGAVLLRKKTTP